MSLLGFPELLTARVLEIKLGTNEGYAHGFVSVGSAGVRIFACMGGNPSNQALINNQAPALASGSIKKLINVGLIDGGGRLDIYSGINGVGTLQGNNPSVGEITLNFDAPFVAGDLLGWQTQRNNSNATWDYTMFMEINWNETLENIQHWYGALFTGLLGASGSFWQIGESSSNAISPLSSRTEFQTRMMKSGTILDFGFYGASPVGIDNIPVWELEINGIVASSQVLTQHAGRVFDNFVGVNIPFAVGDLINLFGVSANNTARLVGLPTMRIQFD